MRCSVQLKNSDHHKEVDVILVSVVLINIENDDFNLKQQKVLFFNSKSLEAEKEGILML